MAPRKSHEGGGAGAGLAKQIIEFGEAPRKPCMQHARTARRVGRPCTKRFCGMLSSFNVLAHDVFGLETLGRPPPMSASPGALAVAGACTNRHYIATSWFALTPRSQVTALPWAAVSDPRTPRQSPRAKGFHRSKERPESCSRAGAEAEQHQEQDHSKVTVEINMTPNK